MESPKKEYLISEEIDEWAKNNINPQYKRLKNLNAKRKVIYNNNTESLYANLITTIKDCYNFMLKKQLNYKEFCDDVDNINSTQNYPFHKDKILFGFTPKIFSVIGYQELPLYMTSEHLYTCIKENGFVQGNNIHYHNLSVDLIKTLPFLLPSTFLIAKSNTHPDNLISFIDYPIKDINGKDVPLLTIYNPGGSISFERIKLQSNKLASIYGKDDIQKWLNNFDLSQILYLNKKISQQYQLTTPLDNSVAGLVQPSSFYINNISQYVQKVNLIQNNRKLVPNTKELLLANKAIDSDADFDINTILHESLIPNLTQIAPTISEEVESFEQKQTGILDIVGKRFDVDEKGTPTFEGLKSLSKAMEIYSDKHYETARYLFIRDGQIVRHVTVSSQTPASTTIKPNENFLYSLRTYAENTGSKIVFLHNHPSGYVEPSEADIKLTNYLANFFTRNGESLFSGHIILDHGTYGLYTEKTREWGALINGELKPLSDLRANIRINFPANTKIANFNPDFSISTQSLIELSEYAKECDDVGTWNTKDWVPCLLLSSNGIVTNFDVIKNHEFENIDILSSKLKQLGREYGSENIVLFPRTSKQFLITERFAQLTRKIKDIYFEKEDGTFELSQFPNGNIFNDLTRGDIKVSDSENYAEEVKIKIESENKKQLNKENKIMENEKTVNASKIFGELEKALGSYTNEHHVIEYLYSRSIQDNIHEKATGLNDEYTDGLFDGNPAITDMEGRLKHAEELQKKQSEVLTKYNGYKIIFDPENFIENVPSHFNNKEKNHISEIVEIFKNRYEEDVKNNRIQYHFSELYPELKSHYLPKVQTNGENIKYVNFSYGEYGTILPTFTLGNNGEEKTLKNFFTKEIKKLEDKNVYIVTDGKEEYEISEDKYNDITSPKNVEEFLNGIEKEYKEEQQKTDVSIEQQYNADDVAATIRNEEKFNNNRINIPELQKALKSVLKEVAIPLEKIDFTRDNYNKLFPYSKIETPIENVKMGEHQFEKLEAKQREFILKATHDTLKNPDVIINEERKNIFGEQENSHLYAKSFLINDKVHGIQSVVVSIDNENVSISTHERDINNFVNKIKKPDQLLYAAAKVRLLVERATGKQLVTVNPTRESEYVKSLNSNVQQNSEPVKSSIKEESNIVSTDEPQKIDKISLKSFEYNDFNFIPVRKFSDEEKTFVDSVFSDKQNEKNLSKNSIFYAGYLENQKPENEQHFEKALKVFGKDDFVKQAESDADIFYCKEKGTFYTSNGNYLVPLEFKIKTKGSEQDVFENKFSQEIQDFKTKNSEFLQNISPLVFNETEDKELMENISDVLSEGDTFTRKNQNLSSDVKIRLGELFDKKNSEKLSPTGLRHLIKHRIEERLNKGMSLEDAQKQVSCLLFLAINNIDKAPATKEPNGHYAIYKNGIKTVIGTDKKGHYVVTGFDYNNTNQEAEVAIGTGIARYGYTPEFLDIYAQVGASLASLGINVSQSQKKSNNISKNEPQKNTDSISQGEEELRKELAAAKKQIQALEKKLEETLSQNNNLQRENSAMKDVTPTKDNTPANESYTVSKNNQNQNAPGRRRNNDIDTKNFSSENAFLTNTPVPKFGLKGDDGKIRIIEGAVFKQQLLDEKDPSANKILLEIPKEDGTSEEIKISEFKYQQIINGIERLNKFKTEMGNKQTMGDWFKAHADYNQALLLDEFKLRENTAANFLHNFKARCLLDARNRDEAIKIAARMVKDMDHKERKRFNKDRKEKGAEEFDNILMDIFDETHAQKELAINDVDIFYDVSLSNNSLERGLAEENRDLNEMKTGDLIPGCEKFKVGDTVPISITTKGFKGKQRKTPKADFKIARVSKNVNPPRALIFNEKTKAMYLISLTDLKNHLKKVERSQLEERNKIAEKDHKKLGYDGPEL